MRKKNYKDVENKEATLSDGTPVKDVYVRWLIDENDGAQHFAMRRFEIKPGIKVPLHNHKQDHEIYILNGEGRFYNDSGQDEQVKSGDIIYIPPYEKHGIDNLGDSDFIFLCLVPYFKETERIRSIPNE
jgi:quercetin dioxygenase-like cupin family protein